MSVAAGLSTFSKSKGLYEQAAQRFGLKEGQELFRYPFLEGRPNDCFDFFVQLYREAQKAKPTKTHQALAQLLEGGQLVRHYTMNIDGLATRATTTDGGNTTTTTTCGGISSTTHMTNKAVVELHGTLHELVCRKCQTIFKTSKVLRDNKKWGSSSKGRTKRDVAPPEPPNCSHCNEGHLRFKILMYDDKEGHLIHKNSNSNDNDNDNDDNHNHHVTDPLGTSLNWDLTHCQALLWMGVSFEQSASCEHFRTSIQQLPKEVPIYLINPDAENALFQLQTAIGGDSEDHSIFMIKSTCDELFENVLEKDAGKR